MAPPPMPPMAMLLAMLVLTGGTPKKGVVKEVGKYEWVGGTLAAAAATEGGADPAPAYP